MKMLLPTGLVTGSKGKSRENQTNALKITCMKVYMGCFRSWML